MMKHRVVTLLLFFLACLLNSCGVYRPNMVNVPIFEKKQEIKAGLYEGFNGTDLQASYAVSNNLGFVLNYNLPITNRTDYSAINYNEQKHSLIEAGLGISKNLKNKHKNIIGELIVLAGKGEYNKIDQGLVKGNLSMQNWYANFWRTGLQADIAILKGNWIIAYSPRIMVVHYYNTNDPNNLWHAQQNIYTEGAITLKYKLSKQLQLVGQYFMSFPLLNPTDFSADYAPFNISVGILGNLCFNKK